MTRPRLFVVGAALAGFVVGALLIASLTDGDSAAKRPPASNDGTASTTSSSDTSSSSTSTPSTVPLAPTTHPALPDDRILLLWTAGGLAPGFADRMAASEHVLAQTVVRGAELRLTASRDRAREEHETYTDGWGVPIDALAITPDDHASFVAGEAADVFRRLGPGRAVLSETGAALRGVGEGATLSFTTGDVEVVGVVDDRSASGAELVVDTETGTTLGIIEEKFVLVEHDDNRAELQLDAVAALRSVGVSAPVRLRSPTETTWLRHGDAVLPLAVVKMQFGEFASRDTAGGAVEIDPEWIAEHIVTVDVPILGSVTCHRAMIPALESALQELVDRALAHVIEAGQFAGCFVPRRIATGEPHSRHAWGIAVDINVGDNPRGSFSTQDPRLVDAMRTAGFGWGGSWLVPDPAHYEVIEP